MSKFATPLTMLYPPYMSMSDLYRLSEPDMPMYLPVNHNDFVFDSSPLYHSDGPLDQGPLLSVGFAPSVPPPRLGKRGSVDSAVDFSSMGISGDARCATPPTKRSRKEPLPSGRVPGACTRCKRLKVFYLCTFFTVELIIPSDEVHVRRQ